jgi:hypothetical protein
MSNKGKRPVSKANNPASPMAKGRRIVNWKRSWAVIAGFVTLAATVIGVERGRETQIRDQQAMLRGIGPVIDTTVKPYVVRMQIKNEGKTTAYGMGGRINTPIRFGADGGQDPNFDALHYQSQHIIDLSPQSIENTSQILFSEKMGLNPQEMIDYDKALYNLMNHVENETLFVSGGYNYKTEFGDTGVMKYCYRFDPKIYNFVDCLGDSNKSYVIPKSWLGTLLSAIPGFSRSKKTD